MIREDCELFDEMASKVRLRPEATINAAFIDSVGDALLSILLENEKELRKRKMR